MLSPVLNPDFNGVILDVVDVADMNELFFQYLAVPVIKSSHKYQSLITFVFNGNCAQSHRELKNGVAINHLHQKSESVASFQFRRLRPNPLKSFNPP